MKTKKRHRLKNLGVVVSSVMSLSAPYGAANLFKASKESKNCKKSRTPHSAAAPKEVAEGPPSLAHVPGVPAFETGLQLLDFGDPSAILRLPGVAAADRVLPPGPSQVERYAWRCQIATTMFWIGEAPSGNNPTPNDQSCWDEKWAENYGGSDSPEPGARRGFLPASFIPKQNPFYVALPYNDLGRDGHKEEAQKVIPWFKRAYERNNKSVCKGRWIAIRKGSRICYAQWEDAGPGCTTDVDYVFGSARPKSSLNNSSGIDVSPAVRDYLELSGEETTDWRFADFDEVPYGPWSEYGTNNTFVMNRGQSQGVSVAMANGGRQGAAGLQP